MSNIEYDNDKFSVVNEYTFSDNVCYRMIRFDTGYYALQEKIPVVIIDDDSEKEVDSEWITLVISPEYDDPLKPGRDWKEATGRLTMLNILDHIGNTDKLQNEEYMELHLHLNPDLDDESQDEIIELIESSDGKELIENINNSILTYDQEIPENKVSYTVNLVTIILYIIIFILILIFVKFIIL